MVGCLVRLGVDGHTAAMMERECHTLAIGALSKSGTVLFDREAVFADGHRMAIQVVSSPDEPAWTQGVLFDANGAELGCTDVGESFLGEYSVLDGGTRYSVLVGLTASEEVEESVVVKFSPNDRGNPPGKLADAELHFADGLLAGTKLIGFAVWERRDGQRNVTFPARQYSVNGERRSFALLRPVLDASATDRIRDHVLAAYAMYEEQRAVAEATP